jgi:hypothetical protein
MSPRNLIRAASGIALLLLALCATRTHAAAKAPDLSFVSPTGGETYIIGQTQTISLNVKSSLRTVEVRLSTDGGKTFPTVLGTLNNTGTGRKPVQVLSFPVPDLASVDCMLQATGTSAKGSIVATSGRFVIGTPFLGVGSVTSQILGAGAVTDVKLADGSVTTAKLADGAVTNPKLANLAVSDTKVTSAVGGTGGSNATNNFVLAADGAGGAAWKNVSSLGILVQTANIAPLSVDLTKIATGTITTAQINPLAGITDAQVNDDLTITNSPGINASPIGATTPSTGVFTNVTVNNALNLTGTTILTLPNLETISNNTNDVVRISDGTDHLDLDLTSTNVVLRGRPSTGDYRVEGADGGVNGNGVPVKIVGGSGGSTSGAGGQVRISGGIGNGNNNNGGSIILDPGLKTGGGSAKDGTVDITGTVVNLDSDSAVPTDIQLVANQGAAPKGILQYTAGTTNAWQISNNGGAFATILTTASGSFWTLTGNTGTNSASNFIGTTDPVDLIFRVNNAQAMRYVPGSSPTIIGGHGGNNIGSAAVIGATIGGGGSSGAGNTNLVHDRFGTIGGGEGNIAGTPGDAITETHAAIAGGFKNSATSQYSSIGGGTTNRAGGAAGLGIAATVGGGESNNADGQHSSIAGGKNNTAGGNISFAAGESNSASATNATAIGKGNTASNTASVAVGQGNTASGTNSIALGQSNITSGTNASALGQGNTANTTNATAIGLNNTASGVAGIAAGQSTQARGANSMAFGQSAIADTTHNNSFIWADLNGYTTTAANQFLISASGGFLLHGIFRASDGNNPPTQVTDAQGKVLSSALNTVQVPQGGTSRTSLTTNAVLYGDSTNPVADTGASTAAGQFLQTTTTGAAPTWKTILGVANGGTGLASGTDGGVLAYTATGVISSSGLLANNQIVLGGGAGGTPKTGIGLGTTTTVLHGNAGGAPTFGAVDLTADVSNILPIVSGGTGAGTGTPVTQNKVFASPDLATGLPTFRALTGNDLPLAGAPYVLKTGDTMSGALTMTKPGNGNVLLVTSGPLVSGTSLVQFGSDVNAFNNSANGGTYVGINAPNAGAGAAADFINFQQNSVDRFKVTGAGNVTATSYTGNLAATNITGQVTVPQGGTGRATLPLNAVLFGNNAGNVSDTGVSANAGAFLQTTASGGAPSWKAILDTANGGSGVGTGSVPAQNLVFASPSGAAGLPTFRALVSNDLPSGGSFVLKAGDTMTGPLVITNGTGATTSLNINTQPKVDAANALAALGNAIAGGNSDAGTGGTFIGINAPAASFGSTADFEHFQNNGVTKYKVSATGAVTGASYKGLNVAATPLVVSAGTPTANSNGNDTTLSATNATGNNSNGGNVTVQSGDATGTNADGGDITLNGGTASTTGFGGDIVLNPGNSTSGAKIGRVSVTRNMEFTAAVPTITATAGPMTITTSGANDLTLTAGATGNVVVTRPIQLGANSLTTTGTVTANTFNGAFTGNINGNLSNASVTVTATSGSASIVGNATAADKVVLTAGATGGVEVTNGKISTPTNLNLSGNAVTVATVGTNSLTLDATSNTANKIILSSGGTSTVEVTSGKVSSGAGNSLDLTGATSASLNATGANNVTLNASANAANKIILSGGSAGGVELTTGDLFSAAGTTLDLTGNSGATLTATANNVTVQANATAANKVILTGGTTGGVELTNGDLLSGAGTTLDLTGATGATLTATTNNVTIQANTAAGNKIILSGGATGGVELTNGALSSAAATPLTLTGATTVAVNSTGNNNITLNAGAGTVFVQSALNANANAVTTTGLGTFGTLSSGAAQISSNTGATAAVALNNTIAAVGTNGIALQITGGAFVQKTANWDGTAANFDFRANVLFVSGFAANTIVFPTPASLVAGHTVTVINTDAANNVSVLTNAANSTGLVLLSPANAYSAVGQKNGAIFVWDGTKWRAQ